MGNDDNENSIMKPTERELSTPMKQDIVIAVQDDILRSGLRTIFAEDERVANIYEVASSEDLRSYLDSARVTFVVIEQVLVTDLAMLSRNYFVILTDEPDMQFLQEAYRYGAYGYLSVHVTAIFLHAMLSPRRGLFLIDPSLTPWMMSYIDKLTRSSLLEYDSLTSREREVESLIREGLSRHEIAEHLCIATSTVKTHQKHITQKRSKEQHDNSS